jgi:hypothetical protein
MRAEIRVTFDDTVADKTNDIVYRALLKAADFLLTETIKTTPKDDGLLIQSGDTAGDRNTMTAYAYFNTPYAVRLHEHPEYNFQNGRRGKYLELTLLEKKSDMMRLIADEIKGAR